MVGHRLHKLPEGYDVRDIDLSTISLAGVAATQDQKYGFVTDENLYLTDRDGDGILERMVEFDREQLADALTPGLRGN